MRVHHLAKELDNISDDFIQYNNQIKRRYNLSETDIRFTFFRASHHNIDACIHLLLMSDEGTSNITYLEEAYKKFNLHDRFEMYSKSSTPPQEILFVITGQLIKNGFHTSMYHLFENAFRIICQRYNKKMFEIQEKFGFGGIYDHFIKDYKNKTPMLDNARTHLYEYVQIVRNSIHNNGVYIDRNKHDRLNVLNFNNIHITIEHDKPIKTEDGIWDELFKMSRWYMGIIGGIITVPFIEGIRYIEDPSQKAFENS